MQRYIVPAYNVAIADEQHGNLVSSPPSLPPADAFNKREKVCLTTGSSTTTVIVENYAKSPVGSNGDKPRREEIAAGDVSSSPADLLELDDAALAPLRQCNFGVTITDVRAHNFNVVIREWHAPPAGIV